MTDKKIVSLDKITPMEAAKRLSKMVILKKEIEDSISKLRKQLLEETKKLGVLTLKTEEYLITRKKAQRVYINDYDIVGKELENLGQNVSWIRVFDYDSEQVAKKLIKKGEIKKGATISESEYVSITINKGKDK